MQVRRMQQSATFADEYGGKWCKFVSKVPDELHKHQLGNGSGTLRWISNPPKRRLTGGIRKLHFWNLSSKARETKESGPDPINWQQLNKGKCTCKCKCGGGTDPRIELSQLERTDSTEG